MRIAVDASIQRADAPFPTGVERAQRAIVRAVVAASHDDLELVAVAPSQGCAELLGLDETAAVGLVNRPISPWAWREVQGISAACAAGCDLWWSPVTALPVRARIDTVATVHDVPWGPSVSNAPAVGERGVVARARLAHAAKTAWRVVCPSLRTADDVVALHRGARVRVVPHGIDERERVDQALDRSPRVLCVGTLRRKKNFGVVLDALLDERLRNRGVRAMFVGAHGSATASMRNHAAAAHVDFAGPCDDVALAGEYARASVVVVPSWLEGFGLVSLEAMAAGLPVIVSDQAFVDEACGEAALTFDGRSASGLADQIVRVLDDVTLRDTLRVKGNALVAIRTHARAARAMLDVFEEWRASR